MVNNPTVGIQLLKKLVNKRGQYPVKLRVTFQRQPRYFATSYSMTEGDFSKTYSSRPGDNLRAVRVKLDTMIKKAQMIVEQLGDSFTFDAFKQLMYKNIKDHDNVFSAYADYIKELKQQKRDGTAESYESSLSSIKDFSKKERLQFRDIDSKYLVKYEIWMLDKNKSKATIGIYLRALRHLVKIALKNNLITVEQYPFGEGKYIIPTGANIKKALSMKDIQKIFTYQPENHIQERARDIWTFIYLSNGINLKDVCLLKYSNIHGNIIIFERAKTIRTKKDAPEIIKVPILSQTREIIARWGNEVKTKDNYIFPFLTPGLSSKRERELIKYLTKNINTQMKNIALNIGLSTNLTTYVARHSFSTVLKRSGASIEYISEALGHSDIKTTKNYLANFEDETLQAHALQLVNFDKGKSKTKQRKK